MPFQGEIPTTALLAYTRLFTHSYIASLYPCSSPLIAVFTAVGFDNNYRDPYICSSKPLSGDSDEKCLANSIARPALKPILCWFDQCFSRRGPFCHPDYRAYRIYHIGRGILGERRLSKSA